jgi:thiamine-phosphate pyrophosphorylase
MMEDKKGRISGLYAVIDSAYVPVDRMRDVAWEMVDGGAGVIQLRAKGLSAADTLKAARSIKSVTDKAVFIVNDRVDVAMLAGADGVHLGQEDIPADQARGLLGVDAVIGVSTHNVAEAVEAFSRGADYVSFGPVFPTRTKGDADVTKGIEGLAEFRQKVTGTVVAIGGITGENLGGVITAGADSVAIISDILLSGGIRARVSSVIRKIETLRA